MPTAYGTRSHPPKTLFVPYYASRTLNPVQPLQQRILVVYENYFEICCYFLLLFYMLNTTVERFFPENDCPMRRAISNDCPLREMALLIGQS